MRMTCSRAAIWCFLAIALPGQEPKVPEATLTPDLAITALREQLAAARAHTAAGRYVEARTLIAAARRAAAELPQAGEREDVASLLSDLGEEAFDATDYPLALDAWRAALAFHEPRLPEDAMLLQVLRTRAGEMLRRLGKADDAKQLFERAIGNLEGKVPDYHKTLQVARGNLVNVLLAEGDTSGALQLQTKVLDIWKGRLAEEHPDMVRSRQNLAAILAQSGELQEAHDLLREVYEVRKRVLPRYHRDRLIAMANVAVAKWQLGERQVAVAMMEEACVALEATAGKDHPDQLLLQGKLVSMRWSMGMSNASDRSFEDLEKAYRAAGMVGHSDAQILRWNHARHRSGNPRAEIEALERQLGELRGRTAATEPGMDVQMVRRDLANAYERVGDSDKALRLLQEALEANARSHSDDDIVLRRARADLALLMVRCGDVESGERLLRSVCGAYAKDTPVENIYRLETEGALGDIEMMRERPAAGLEILQRVLTIMRRVAPEDTGMLLPLQANLATCKLMLGRTDEARVELAAILAAWLAAGSGPENPNVLSAMLNLATAENELGNLEEACRLHRIVCEEQAKLLPAEHPRNLIAQAGLAGIQLTLGHIREANDILVPVVAGLERLFPDDFLNLQVARENFAAVRLELGDLRGALALYEKVYDVRHALPEDSDPRLRAMGNLGGVKVRLGDLDGGLALTEAAAAGYERIFPEEHLSLLLARRNLAHVHSQRGDDRRARAILEDVVQILAAHVGEEHPDRLAAESDLAATLGDVGDWSRCRSTHERVATMRRRILPPYHGDLLQSLSNLGIAMERTGDPRDGMRLHEEVLATRTHYLPADHPDIVRARSKVLRCAADLGERSKAEALAVEQAQAVRKNLVALTLSPREFGALARDQAFVLDELLTLATGYGSLDPVAELVAPALLVACSIRGAETFAARMSRTLSRRDNRYEEVLARGSRAAADLARQVQGTLGPAEEPKRQQAILTALATRDQAQRELHAMVRGSLPFEMSEVEIGDLVRALPDGAAALTVVAYSHLRTRDGATERRLAAVLMRREGTVQVIALGPERVVHGRIEEFRTAVAGKRDGEAAGRTLFDLVLEPIVRLLKDERSLFVSMDPALQLVPWDALSTGEGLLGERVRIRGLTTPMDLLVAPGAPDPSERPHLVAVGGIDYEQVEGTKDAAHASELGQARDGVPGSFRRLENSLREVVDVQRAFDAAFPEGRTSLLTGQKCSKVEFTSVAESATFLHLATHGYFDSGVPLDALRLPPLLHLGKTAPAAVGTTRGLSPLSVTGLALSGANLPADGLGRRIGILTGEEVAALDLSKCETVVLAVCDSGVGLQRTGQDLASLRSAFFGAGAGTVLCALWPVDDEATRDFMAEFYRRRWTNDRPAAEALWEAKMAMRAQGSEFVHWAGWLLTEH